MNFVRNQMPPPNPPRGQPQQPSVNLQMAEQGI